MGFKFLKAIEALRGGTLFFTSKLLSILSFPQKVAADYFSILKCW